MKKLFFLLALLALITAPLLAQDHETIPAATTGDPLTIIVTAIASVIVGAIARGIEKRRLRKAGKLVDKPQE